MHSENLNPVNIQAGHQGRVFLFQFISQAVMCDAITFWHFTLFKSKFNANKCHRQCLWTAVTQSCATVTQSRFPPLEDGLSHNTGNRMKNVSVTPFISVIKAEYSMLLRGHSEATEKAASLKTAQKNTKHYTDICSMFVNISSANKAD